VATRIIDLFLIDGWKIIFKLALELLSIIKDELMILEYEEALRYLKTFSHDIVLDEVRYNLKLG